ncbi:hypothetical protein H7J07_16710 [Mycobacterium koreense]|uniref:Uncharacterized protein n=1 Tax=Mycolicibacillus koreensis TaxID=1069220 RepID=A0A7I7S9E1_9MYCO|nr:hypothetical protein [Mycolicibacillus koreensis]MCV7249844.1 hypothetical protein [Mycolicibacillus koreensis]OSC25098.1 hypothetical protein B8W67_19175 [Mycolicibacillus koreensis]BBY52939.1 hypothetical protein MKOR_01900 [Mycolicibacillus koreensis]
MVKSGPAHALVDSANWPRCERYDGAEQACWCYFADEHEQVGAEGWPGGKAGHFADFLSVTLQHDCNAAWRPAATHPAPEED